MPFQVMQLWNSLARFKWLEEEYVDFYLVIFFSISVFHRVETDISEQRIQL